MDREDKSFGFNPALTAEVMIQAEDGLVTIDGIRRLIKTNQKGIIKRIIANKDKRKNKPWIGIIGDKDSEDNEFIFNLVTYQTIKLRKWERPKPISLYSKGKLPVFTDLVRIWWVSQNLH